MERDFYNREKLKALFLFKGYGTYMQPASEILNCEVNTASTKINRGRLSHEDTIALAKGLKMTPRQYCEIFMNGVFKEIE